jgi:hypothetical protein
LPVSVGVYVALCCDKNGNEPSSGSCFQRVLGSYTYKRLYIS